MHIAGLLNNMTAEEKEFFLKHEQMHQELLKQHQAEKASQSSKYLFRDEAHRDEWNRATERMIQLRLKAANKGAK